MMVSRPPAPASRQIHHVVPCDIGLSHLDVQYLANLCHTLHRAHTMFGRSVGLPSAAAWPPPPLGAMPASMQASEDRWPRRHRVARVRPFHSRQHVHAAGLDLRGLRVLVLVDHVLVTDTPSAPASPAPPRLQKCQVLPGIAVEHHLVRDHWYASRAGDSSDGKRYLGTPWSGRADEHALV